MKYTNIRIVGAFIIAVGIGILIGKFLPAKKSKPEKKQYTEATSKSFPYRLLNPALACSPDKQLSMEGLVAFKPEIENYIKTAKRKKTDLHIAYYFLDLNSDLWISVNQKDMFSPASLMKVLIMISVLKEAQTKPGLLTTSILFEKNNFTEVDEESGFEKKDGQYYTVEELIKQMIAYSDNAAALILMEYIGMDKIAQTENDLGLHIDEKADINTNFVQVNQYAAIFRTLYNAAYLNKEMSEKALNFLSQSVYKNGIRAAVSAQYTLAQKYGERDMFDKAGKRHTLQLHNFGIVYHPIRPYLIGIMTRGADKETKEKIIYDLAKITHTKVEKLK